MSMMVTWSWWWWYGGDGGGKKIGGDGGVRREKERWHSDEGERGGCEEVMIVMR